MADITQNILDAFFKRYPEIECMQAAAASPERVRERLEDALQECNVDRWGVIELDPPSFRARGMFAYAAHRTVLDAAAQRAVESGGTPEAAKQVQSKSVSDESVTYAIPVPGEQGADRTGDLRTTIYGQEFLRLRKRAAAGPASTGSHWR